MSSLVQLSNDQTGALSALLGWFKAPKKQSLTLGGYAGTGKTMLAGVFRKALRSLKPKMSVAFVSYTGRASQVLNTSLREAEALYETDSCGTIHSLMYRPRVNKEGKVTGWRKVKEIEADLIVIDEASMVTKNIWNDLMEYGLPILAIGDHGQLPPVEGESFNLMTKTDLSLERVHRQAEGDPIIRLSMLARKEGRIPYGEYSQKVRKLRSKTPRARELYDDFFRSDAGDALVLCGRNATRVRLNSYIRGLLGRRGEEPEKGEKLICLKNSYSTSGGHFYNGMVGVAEEVEPYKRHWYEARIYFKEEERYFSGNISRHQFNKEQYVDSVPGLHYKDIGERYDFGYAMTVHKAQGSQARRVLLFEEPAAYWEGEMWNRWLYTAVTRAREELYIVG